MFKMKCYYGNIFGGIANRKISDIKNFVSDFFVCCKFAGCVLYCFNPKEIQRRSLEPIKFAV